jgi:hypothetical protein
VKLPKDMTEIARAEGLRASVLQRFKATSGLTAFLFNAFPAGGLPLVLVHVQAPSQLFYLSLPLKQLPLPLPLKRCH